MFGALPEGNQALLAALAQDLEETLVQEHGEGGESGQFGHPQPRGVEQLDPGPVPHPQGREQVRSAQEGHHLRLGEGPGQDPRRTGRTDHGFRAGGAFPFQLQEAEELPEGAGQPGDAAGGLAGALLADQEGGDLVPVQLGGGQFHFHRPGGQVGEVGKVAGHRVRRQSALNS